MPPNVLIVVMDAARRDALEPYGARRGATPAIAQLAARGVAMPEVYATAPWTVPSHSSMFTGLMPRAAGMASVPSHAAVKPAMESHRDRLLPELMRRAGYSTSAFSANLWVAPAAGFDIGFDHFHSVGSARKQKIRAGGRKARLRWLAEGARGEVDDGAAEIEGLIGQRLSAHRGADPFFMFVNLVECHSPYLPPRPYGGRLPLRRILAAEDARRYFTLQDIWRVCGGVVKVPESTLRRSRHFYRASIRYMDDWLARLLERLDGSGALDDTLVVVTSDHGENFGEGGLVTHGLSLDNRLIGVPFVAAGPGADATPITSLAELPRFVADAAGIDSHPWHDAPRPGVGVAQFDPPSTEDEEKTREALVKWGLGGAIEAFTSRLTCAVAGDLKLLRRGDVEEVYDLAADPLEERPLRPEDLDAERSARLAPLRAALEQPAMTRELDAAGAAERPPEASAEELADLEERMRLLGYM
jgi:arylsulfatase A-like enzyme